jgi:hypothetical protein
MWSVATVSGHCGELNAGQSGDDNAGHAGWDDVITRL